MIDLFSLQGIIIDRLQSEDLVGVLGVKFKNTSKAYWFSAGNFTYAEGQGVIVETAKGNEFGTVAILPKEVSEDEIVSPLKPVVRLATEKDLQRIKGLGKLPRRKVYYEISWV